MIKTLLFSILLFLASYLAVEILFTTQSRTLQSDYIGVLSYETDGNVLRRVRVEDGDTQIMATFSGVAYADGVWWSPDGQHMATAAFENHNIKRIFYVDMNGNVTPLADFGWHTPTLSPDHEQLAILAFGTGSGSDLAVMDIDGNNGVQFQLSAIGNPHWSPDDDWIAFADGQIYKVRPDGTDLEAITPPDLAAFDIAWSPDSDWIAFSGVEPNGELRTADIFIVKVDGSDLIQLTDDLLNAQQPTWSPNGAMIAFSAGEAGRQEIYRHRLSDQSTTKLTSNESRARNPLWSPEGERIAFLAFDTLSECVYCYDAVYVMNADGTHQRQITVNVPVSDFAWSPIIR